MGTALGAPSVGYRITDPEELAYWQERARKQHSEMMARINAKRAKRGLWPVDNINQAREGY